MSDETNLAERKESGKILIRTAPEMHYQAKQLARRRGISMNTLFEELLRRELEAVHHKLYAAACGLLTANDAADIHGVLRRERGRLREALIDWENAQEPEASDG